MLLRLLITCPKLKKLMNVVGQVPNRDTEWKIEKASLSRDTTGTAGHGSLAAVPVPVAVPSSILGIVVCSQPDTSAG